MSPRTTFINELNQLKENVADMATRVEKNYETPVSYTHLTLPTNSRV